MPTEPVLPLASLIDQALFDKVCAEASLSPRRRKNFNFHGRDSEPSHRLLNAIEPDSYLAPHRHLDPDKDETMIALRGRFGIVLFAADGTVVQTHVLEAGSPCCGITIPHGVFHTLVSCQSGSILFESKAGPYLPLAADERAAWAPAEGSDDVMPYASRLRQLFVLS
jgi:cupin fold WbuC family metalloprotein